MRAKASEVLVEDGVRLHDHASSLNSSMAFALNLFLPFRLGDARPLGLLLSRHLGRSLTVDAVRFEYTGPLGVLAETSSDTPGPHEPRTAADVAISVRDADGRRGLVLVEVKLTEEGFSRCNGAVSAANVTPATCASAATFFDDPSSCYLRRPARASRDRRYWVILENACGSVAAAYPGAPREGPCPFRGDWQQPMRNRALVLGMIQTGAVDFGAIVLVHHDDNPDVVGPWDGYAAAVAQAIAPVRRAPASEIIAATDAALGATPAVSTWLEERYFLGEVG